MDFNFQIKKNHFAFKDYKFSSPNDILLNYDPWDDYGYKTYFNMFAQKKDEVFDIGGIRILHIKSLSTFEVIDKEFNSLNQDFISMGTSDKYYENIIEVFGEEKALELLRSLNDITISHLKKTNFFIEHQGIQDSLFRSSDGRYLYNEVYNKYFSKNLLKNNDYKFIFKTYYKKDIPTNIEIDFKKYNQLPNRLFALIGKNGVGKTTFLNQLSKSLYDSSNPSSKNRFKVINDENENGNIEVPAFNKIIAISFSAFDNFFKGKKEEHNQVDEDEVEETKHLNYTYIGISNIDNNVYKSTELEKINISSFESLCKQNRSEELKNALNDSNILNHEIKSTSDLKTIFTNKYSSGQKIFISMLSRFISEINTSSLIFLDEPELYLHPNAISSLMKIFSSLLEKYDSYAILCTHSPILIREIPSRFVRNLLLIDNDTVIQSELSIETFGSNISDVSREVFNVSDDESQYKSVFKTLAEKHKMSEIEQMFDNNLSLKATMYLTQLYSEKNNGLENN
ncbi:AAA family ATPase [Lactococcus lactis]|uniref:AAA family ATPase n=1 Tax=Lactococcus lactis TaxID=1358 RepID=UPI0025A1A9EE|nr:AAA family ATPase [Lactococcus lactis]MDM7502029.1 AAA family ATPase [Lactococcus lactis]MDM7521092.1 AAA family ATPase [Lactococcus lactis]